MKIIKNAIIASKVWNEFESANKENIKKYFHIRPTNKGITLVTTHPSAPMRGVKS